MVFNNSSAKFLSLSQCGRSTHLCITMILLFFSFAGRAEDTLSIYVDHTQSNFIVSLKANPTTGYQWSLVRFDKQLLTLAESEYESSKTHLIGSGGKMLFTFSLNREMSYPKSTQMVFKYARPWDKGESARVQNVTVYFK